MSERQPPQMYRYDGEDDNGDDEGNEQKVFFFHGAFRALVAA